MENQGNVTPVRKPALATGKHAPKREQDEQLTKFRSTDIICKLECLWIRQSITI